MPPMQPVMSHAELADQQPREPAARRRAGIVAPAASFLARSARRPAAILCTFSCRICRPCVAIAVPPRRRCIDSPHAEFPRTPRAITERRPSRRQARRRPARRAPLFGRARLRSRESRRGLRSWRSVAGGHRNAGRPSQREEPRRPRFRMQRARPATARGRADCTSAGSKQVVEGNDPTEVVEPSPWRRATASSRNAKRFRAMARTARVMAGSNATSVSATR